MSSNYDSQLKYVEHLNAELGLIDVDYLSSLELTYYFKVLNKLTDVEKLNRSTFLRMSFSHGDFTRWNVRLKSDSICVFDWEEAKFRPLGFDVFHYCLVETVLINKNVDVDSFLKFAKRSFLKGPSDDLYDHKVRNFQLYISIYMIEQVAFSTTFMTGEPGGGG